MSSLFRKFPFFGKVVRRGPRLSGSFRGGFMLPRYDARFGLGFRYTGSTCVAAVFTALCSWNIAYAAEPLTITFQPGTINSVGNWEVLPKGSSIKVKATPELYKQTKTIILKYILSSQYTPGIPVPPPGPEILTLNANRVASGPLKSQVYDATHFGVQACYTWQPVGSNQKKEECTAGTYFEFVNPVVKNAEKWITMYVYPTFGAPIPQSGSELRLRVHKEVVMNSNNKEFRLYWAPEGEPPLPASEKSPLGKISFDKNVLGAVKLEFVSPEWWELRAPLSFGTHGKKILVSESVYGSNVGGGGL